MAYVLLGVPAEITAAASSASLRAWEENSRPPRHQQDYDTFDKLNYFFSNASPSIHPPLSTFVVRLLPGTAPLLLLLLLLFVADMNIQFLRSSVTRIDFDLSLLSVLWRKDSVPDSLSNSMICYETVDDPSFRSLFNRGTWASLVERYPRNSSALPVSIGIQWKSQIIICYLHLILDPRTCRKMPHSYWHWTFIRTQMSVWRKDQSMAMIKAFRHSSSSSSAFTTYFVL